METIVFLERDTIRAELRPPAFEHRWLDYGATRPEEVLERLRGATVAVVNKLPLRADVLGRSDVLSLHVPLGAETRGLVGRDEIALMKPSSVLINCARGGVVDEA